MTVTASSERRRYLNEVSAFIGSEIKHAAWLVDKFRNRDHRDQRFVASAERYVAALLAGRERVAMGKRDSTDASESDESLQPFPDILRDLTTALFQRVEAEPTRAFALYNRRSGVVPSEVSLEYAVTIRAAEAVNDFYHDRVKGFYPPSLNCQPPLVNLSGGLVAMIGQRQQFAHETAGIFDDRTAIARALAIVQTILDLSCITLPRWSSQHVRIYALIAHEHFHRVLTVSDYVNAWIGSRYRGLPTAKAKRKAPRTLDIDWKSRNKTVREFARDFYINASEEYEPLFGTALVKLAALRYELSQRIWTFLAARKVSAEPYKNPKPLETISAWHAQELLADIGALVVAGPAFAIAFQTAYPPGDTEYELDLFFAKLGEGVEPQEDHPPSLLRLHFHAALLHDLGFQTIAGRLARASAPTWNRGKKVHRGFLAAYAHFLRDRDRGAGRCIADVIDTVVDVAGVASAYDLPYRAQEDVPYASEKALRKWWRDITYQIEDEGRVFTRDVAGIAPADAINAIWWKRSLQGERAPKNRLAWRVALRNYDA
jgi:hypothetical protein